MDTQSFKMDIMAKKREAILKRQAELEASRAQREEELAKQREQAALQKEEQERKKLEYKQRREAILEQYRHKKAADASMERDGGNYRTMKSSQSSWSIYTGPKLFAKPTTKTNLITIQNAIVKALEGAANERTLRRMQETISIHSATCSHFLILFRNRHQFRGLYQYEQKQTDTIKKLDGIGPKLVNKEDILRFYKFDTPKRLFIEVQTRDISLTIIAFALKDHLWAKTKISQPTATPPPPAPPPRLPPPPQPPSQQPSSQTTTLTTSE